MTFSMALDKAVKYLISNIDKADNIREISLYCFNERYFEIKASDSVEGYFSAALSSNSPRLNLILIPVKMGITLAEMDSSNWRIEISKIDRIELN